MSEPEFRPGLADVPVAESAVSFIDGKRARLEYRGLAVETLARESSFEETAWLLLKGDLPTQRELAGFDDERRHRRRLKYKLIDLIKCLPETGHPMDALQAGVASMTRGLGSLIAFLAVPVLVARFGPRTVLLVGILKHDQPLVYLSDKLPSMDLLRNGHTRELDSFEEAGLATLKGGEDLCIVERDDTLRMLGALRATAQCLKCHDASTGDLLGAFSYTLRYGPVAPQP